MRDYVSFLNELNTHHLVDLAELESWWVDRIREYFANEPFYLEIRPGQTFSSVIRGILGQAESREREGRGATIVGTVLQHLIGAKVEILFGNSEPQLHHHAASVADASTTRNGDFEIKNRVVHVTTSATPALAKKAGQNIARGKAPIIVTVAGAFSTALYYLGKEQLVELVEVLTAEQYLAGNFLEWGDFGDEEPIQSLYSLIRMYNKIVVASEQDNSLRIELPL